MPISSTGVITASKALITLDGQVSGVTRASDFAVCDDVNSGTQLKFSVANVTAGSSVTLTAPSASGTLPISGTETVQYVTPVTTDSVTIATTTTTLLINPAGTIAALTLVLPAGTNGRCITMASSQVVTTLTITPNGSDTVLGGLSAFTANGFFTLTFSSTLGKWMRTG
jgi:hypothetical protein